MGGNAEANLHLLQCFFIAHDDSRLHLGRCIMQTIFPRLKILEALVYQFHETLGVQVSRCSNNDIFRMNVLTVITLQQLLIKGANGFFGP